MFGPTNRPKLCPPVLLVPGAATHDERLPVLIVSLTMSPLHPREVLKAVVLANAAAVVLMHRHPSSGDPTPSQDDIQITRRIKEVLELLGVKLLDSIVFGDGRFVSFADDGYL